MKFRVFDDYLDVLPIRALRHMLGSPTAGYCTWGSRPDSRRVVEGRPASRHTAGARKANRMPSRMAASPIASACTASCLYSFL
jgi:hypothetical protein